MDELITGVGSVDRTAALKALITWVDLGVLKEDEENVFRLLEVAEEPTPGGRDPVSRPGECHQRFCLYYRPYLHARIAPSALELPPVSAVHQQQAEQMRMYWKVCCIFFSQFGSWLIMVGIKFIEGMLTNLGTLPLDRIQTMLKFAPGYDRSIDQLGAFMEAARREGLVTGRDGMWRLNR